MATQVQNDEGKRWQTQIQSLKSGIAHIYKSKEFADVQFTVGVRIFKAHRLILAARSPQFLKMLFKKDDVLPLMTNINIHDVSEDGFDILLRYIYTDEIGPMDKDILLAAHKAATSFGQKGLLKACEDRIAEWEINCENVCVLLNQISGIKSMKDRCLQFLKKNAQAVLVSEGLFQATPHTLGLMFDAGYFKHVPVLLLLQNIVRWAVNKFTEQKDYKMVRELLLVSDKPLLGKIGINKLNNDELLAVMDEYPDLLTSEEYLLFSLNTKKKSGEKRWPEWCKPEA